ncbi:hypothetical protein KCU61_g8123, partial [Aureobasidium melanogenum]
MANVDLFRVDSLVAAITGAGSGLGRMMAHALASNGAAKVYIMGRREEKLKETAKGYTNIVPIQVDATSKPSLKAAADFIKSDAGFINMLIVNSGASGPFAVLPASESIADLQEHFWSYSQDEMDQVFALNNTGAFFTLVAFLGLLEAGNDKQNRPDIQSSVVFTASIAGFARALATGVAYIPSKAGTVQSTKMYSTLLAKYGVRVNGIAPGIYPSKNIKIQSEKISLLTLYT